MPRKTSVYLSDEDDALVRAEMARGVSLREIIRRGVGAAGAVEATADLAARKAVDGAEERLAGLVRETQQDAVREALRQGGGY